MKKIIQFIQQFNLQQISGSNLQLSKYILLDSLGQMMIPTDKHDFKKVFWQSYQLVKDEMDEGNAYAKGHPACHFVPALVHLAKDNEKTFEQLLEAFICGYEVGARTGEIVSLKPAIHPHSNWGVIGGVAALAKMYSWNEEQIEQAVNLAGQLVFPTLWSAVFQGYEGRNALIGLNNVHLLLVNDMVTNGISSSPNTWSVMFSEVIGEEIRLEDWNDSTDYSYIEATYFKFYDSCRFCHAPLDLVYKLLKKHTEINLSSIQCITVETYGAAAALNNPQPRNTFAGKFSIPYTVANAICQHYSIENEMVVYDIAKKVHVVETAEMNTLLPERGTKMRIQTIQQTYEAFQTGALGDQKTPDLFKLIVEKFEQNMLPHFSHQEVQAIISDVLENNKIPYSNL